MKSRFLQNMILFAVALGLCGCLPMYRTWDPLPENAPEQLAHSVECRGEMLLIPLISKSKDTVLLGDPILTKYPFENLSGKFRGHEAGLVSVMWGIGSTRHIVAFLLIGSDGVIYDIDVDDMPREPDTDMFFFRARLPQPDLMVLAGLPEWSGSESPFWKLNSLKGLNPEFFRWEHPEESLSVVAEFFTSHPFRVSARDGKWEKMRIPRFTPNVFCEKNQHKLPEYTIQQVLFSQSVSDSSGGYGLRFPDGTEQFTLMDVESKLRKLVKTGECRLIVYQTPLFDFEIDPERERFLFSPELRRFARKHDLPLVIVSPGIPDTAAPPVPGVPPGLRQYWQCPECCKVEKDSTK